MPQLSPRNCCLILFLSAAACSHISYAQDFSAEFGARYMVDASRATFDNADENIRAGGIRRFRVNISGDIADNLEYEAEVDIDGSEIEFTDLKVTYKPSNSDWSVTAGQHRGFYSLDEQTSSRFSSTLERAAFTDAFDFGRRVGVSVTRKGKRYIISAGGFSSNLSEDAGGSFDAGKAASARAVVTPIDKGDTVVHLGASWRYREKGNNGSDLRYRQDPYSRNASDEIINTGRFAQSDNFYGIEAAATTGQFWVAAELSRLEAKGDGSESSASFGGGYVEAGLFVGGKKTYDDGSFDRPEVSQPFGQGGLGALSFVARYDTVDLQDNIYEGILDTYILGADWWPTDSVRFGINYFKIEAENGRANSGDGVLARAQFDF